MEYPEPIVALIAELKKLPSVGPRSAERIAVWMVQHSKANPMPLAEALQGADKEVQLCPVCGFFATEDKCRSCDAPSRDPQLLCVVEQPTDVIPMERSGAFKGYYHCLGGKLSPLDNITPDDLNIASLIRRVEAQPGVEVIMALSADVEGEATSNYISDILQAYPCSVTRIAQGLPAGGGLEHADELTLMRALQGRR